MGKRKKLGIEIHTEDTSEKRLIEMDTGYKIYVIRFMGQIAVQG